jgi:hypothetical protein
MMKKNNFTKTGNQNIQKMKHPIMIYMAIHSYVLFVDMINFGLDIFYFASYYAGHYYSARCYARDFLKQIAQDDKNLQKASLVYGRVADFLKPLWLYFSKRNKPGSKLLKSFAQNIDNAKKFENEGIEFIKKYLN